jgi:hypothetical protein
MINDIWVSTRVAPWMIANQFLSREPIDNRLDYEGQLILMQVWFEQLSKYCSPISAICI